ncbi:ABC transporter ATP-binding protein [Aquamicrobium sp. NLF2-7]|uniref:ABC transporter ATP-binding protein n=1 Tax=Aquamicrobium sp. NLF2-7 TaxID=2918753 RepID=UPI001EFBCC46|nr:ABC transporter ATP-binding protein [Aquamicrobium sp. NLF2-7]MCG8273513.1 ABC transporter ATP-binding protein [Aquamicrobium sp. NLF2-7]
MVAAATAASAAKTVSGLALSFRGISHEFRLDGKPLPVLAGIDLEITAGDFVALLGPSGCGKSTLLRLAAGLDIPASGVVLADGEAITGPDPARVLVFQDPTLFPWRSVRDNVAIGPQARGIVREAQARIDAAVDLVGLSDFAGAYPHQLSGGMAQRAALARALVNDPRLLLLDEPLGKLDSLTRLAMQDELLRLWQSAGYTALLVTHDVEEALLLANRVIVLSDRPAAIRADIAIDLPHPRRRDDAGIVRLRHDILSIMGYGA